MKENGNLKVEVVSVLKNLSCSLQAHLLSTRSIRLGVRSLLYVQCVTGSILTISNKFLPSITFLCSIQGTVCLVNS
jgi:hypothetical protein